ncbi:hypothetical protein IWX90DRAFT_261865 [Phyllosticta citrichinensis]|uniref:Uncharacterized protein n=1 Tax=Phyllosticta citrichinensis TaxID=1130410 RepID=A0ABR1XSP6_9PEZI
MKESTLCIYSAHGLALSRGDAAVSEAACLLVYCTAAVGSSSCASAKQTATAKRRASSLAASRAGQARQSCRRPFVTYLPWDITRYFLPTSQFVRLIPACTYRDVIDQGTAKSLGHVRGSVLASPRAAPGCSGPVVCHCLPFAFLLLPGCHEVIILY